MKTREEVEFDGPKYDDDDIVVEFNGGTFIVKVYDTFIDTDPDGKTEWYYMGELEVDGELENCVVPEGDVLYNLSFSVDINSIESDIERMVSI